MENDQTPNESPLSQTPDPNGAGGTFHLEQADQAEAEALARRAQRDPGGPKAAIASWIAILAVVCFLALTPVAMTFFPQWFETPTEGPVVIDHLPPSGPQRLISKYALGATQLAGIDPGSSDDAKQELAQTMVQQAESMSSSDSDDLRLAILEAALIGPEAGAERLEQIEERVLNPEDDAEAEEFSPEFAEAFAIVDRALNRGVDTLDETQRESIVASDGWFGELLLVTEAPEDDPERKSLYANAMMVTMLLAGALFAVLGLGVIGFGLFITAIVLLLTGKIKPTFRAPMPGGSVYLEMFALFLVLFVLAQFAAGVVYKNAGIDLSKAIVWLICPVFFWPLLRGADVASWKDAIGWHKGKGVFREIGAGFLGYLAGLPIIAIGLVCALLLSALVAILVELFTGAPAPTASHPAIDQIGTGGALGVVMLYLLACVWAPLFEETCFRGAFYHHLRGKWHAIFSALVVALIFASIHPQGIGLIPGLMGMAIVFALLREWRGSLIAPIFTHSMHNATLVTLQLIALS